MIDAYLARLGLHGRPAPTLATLVDLHRRHLDALPYDNLAIMLDRPPSADPAEAVARIGAGDNAGYCFHHNGAFGTVLTELGFAVERREGRMVGRSGAMRGHLDHLVLVVGALPTADNPGGRWWPDVGYGDGFRHPLPLVEGVHRQGSFRYRLARLTERGWTFHHDPDGGFAGTRIGPPGASQRDVEGAHRRLSTPPDGDFTRLLVVQRRDATGADTVRGIHHRRIGAGATERTLREYDDWRAALVGLGVSLAGAGEEELRSLHARMASAHDDWLAIR